MALCPMTTALHVLQMMIPTLLLLCYWTMIHYQKTMTLDILFGPFEITKSPHWTKVLHPMTPTFRSSMLQEKAFVSHTSKFDNIRWEFGQIKECKKTGAFKSHFSDYAL
jgi:hypothetical protein